MIIPNLPTPPHIIRSEFSKSPYSKSLSDMYDCIPAHLLVKDDYMLSEDEEEGANEALSVAEPNAGFDKYDITSIDIDGSSISITRFHDSEDSIRDTISRERSEPVHLLIYKSHESTRKSTTNEVKTPMESNSSMSSPILYSKKNDLGLRSKSEPKKIKKERKKWLNLMRRALRTRVNSNGEHKDENDNDDEKVSDSYQLSDDSKGHHREVSMLSTIPFASLQDDIAESLFEAGITANVEAYAWLEREREQERSFQKEKEVQEERIRSLMHTAEEEIHDNNYDNNSSKERDVHEVDWIKIVESDTYGSGLSLGDDDQFVPRMIRSGSTSSFSSISSVPCNEYNCEEHCSTDCNSENKVPPKIKNNESLNDKLRTSDEISNENADKVVNLGTAFEQNDAEGLTGHTAHTKLVDLLHGKHKRYGSLIKSCNLLKRFGSLNQEEKEFVKQVFNSSKDVPEDAKKPCIKTGSSA